MELEIAIERTQRAVSAIEAVRARENKHLVKAAVKAVFSALLTTGSAGRLPRMLSLIGTAPPEVFWPAFVENWPVCDATWEYRRLLLAVLRKQPPSSPFLTAKQRSLYERLPARVRVFRGCSRERIRGVSWTKSRQVAERFARGHRGIEVPNAVVAVAMISKDAIFLVNHERREREIVLDPRALRIENLLTKVEI